MTTAMNTENHALDQAHDQMHSIRDMVAALEVDFDRLEELREERAALADELEAAADCVRYHHDDELDENGPEIEHAEYRRCRDDLDAWDEENADDLEELEAAAGDCESQEDAEQRIREDALSVEVRSDWHTPGDDSEPTEFQILLCTGGPAVRIMGELQQGEPVRAWLEYQDWGTPWTEHVNQDGDHDALLTYARCFYFGE